MIVIAPSAQIDFMVGVPLQAEAKHTFMPHATGSEGKAARDAAFSSYVCFSLNNATYVRETGEIQATIPWEVEDDEETGRLAFEPDTINYLRYKNVPFDDRWHYCFVERVSYINNNNFRFQVSEDYWQTWGMDVTFHPSYINRMHSPSDGIGENLVPESLDTGRIIIEEGQGTYALVNSLGEKDYDNIIIVICSFGFNQNKDGFIDWWGGEYGGYYSGLNYIAFKDTSYTDGNSVVHQVTKEDCCNAFLLGAALKTKIDGIVGIYCIPDSFLTGTQQLGDITVTAGLVPPPDGISWQETHLYIPYFDVVSDPINEEIGMASPKYSTASGIYPAWPNPTLDNTISGYRVHNNKLFTYPYSFILGTNLNGQEMNYRYEWFDNGARPTFRTSMILAGKPGLVGIPEYYLGMERYENGKLVSENFAPCPYLTDSFSVYLGQLITGGGQLRQAGDLLGSVVSAASGSLSGRSTSVMKYNSGQNAWKPARQSDTDSWSSNFASNPGSLIAAPFNAWAAYQQAFNAADRIGSSAEFGYMEAEKITNIAYFPVHISEEYARKIDRYFSMFGYAYAGIEMPNIRSRTYWNYLECQQPVIQSSVVPQEAVQAMKNSLGNGITFWHNLTSVGQYNLYVDGTGELNNPIYTP